MDKALLDMNGGLDGKQTAVVLPCGPDQFSSFVASLLGRPQEVAGVRLGHFTVDKDEALQLHHLVTQRVEQQNGVQPLQFTARIVFDNGTSVLLNSVEDFNDYNEVRPVRSRSLYLSWTFLLTFPGKSVPEKQEIEFAYLSGWAADPEFMAIDEVRSTGQIQYRIKHTARTWGADIEGLLTHYIDSLIKGEGAFRSVLRQRSGAVGVAVGVTLFALLLGGLVFANQRVFAQQSSFLSGVLGNGVSVSDKLDHLMLYFKIAGESLRSLYTTIYMVIAFAGSVITGIWVGLQVSAYPPSDVLLTRKAVEFHQVRKEEYEGSIRKLLLSLLGAFVLGLAVNVVYDFLIKKSLEEAIAKYQPTRLEESK